MIVAIDVQYGVTAVTTAVVGWHAWTDAAAAWTRVDRHTSAPSPYVPGAFFERELPYVLTALAAVPPPITTAIGVDLAMAAAAVGTMDGPFRLPTLIKLADSLARTR